MDPGMVRSMQGRPEIPMEQPQHTSINQLQTLTTSMLRFNLNQNNQRPHYVTSMDKHQIYQDRHVYGSSSQDDDTNDAGNLVSQYSSVKSYSTTQPTAKHSKLDQQRPCFEIPNSNFQAWLNTNHPQSLKDHVQENSSLGTNNYVSAPNNLESKKNIEQINVINCHVDDKGKMTRSYLVHGANGCPPQWQQKDSDSHMQHKHTLSSHLMQVIGK